MNITVRIATAADAAIIADLSRETFYATYAAVNTKADMDKFLNEQFTREALMAEVTAPGNIFLLALDGDTIAGYIRLRESQHPQLPSNAIEVARLYAATHMIGKGAGKALMLAAISYAKNNEHSCIWLGVWEHNERAREFYRRFGFEQFADADFLLGNDLQHDFLLQLPL